MLSGRKIVDCTCENEYSVAGVQVEVKKSNDKKKQMQDKIENTDKMVLYWLDSADRDQLTMRHLIDTKDYSWALFLGHLVIEKTLKALYVKRLKKHALFSHDLLRLAGKINLTLSDEQEEWFDRITTFNINSRYDNYKQDFYKLCTEEFTKDWLRRIEELRLWLRNQL